MVKTLKAKFDGRVLIPLDPVELPVGPELEITVVDPSLPATNKSSLQRLGEKLASLPAPTSPGDRSVQHDHYLYGSPKRQEP